MRIMICLLLMFFPFVVNTPIMAGAAANSNKSENTQAFREVKVSGTNGDYFVTGESRAAARGFFYSVEDGHLEFIRETQVKLKQAGGKWQPFQLHVQIPEDKLPNNGTVLLNLYHRSRDGQITKLYPVILEKFQ